MFLEALSFSTRPPEGGRSVLVGGLFVLPTAALVAVAGLDPRIFPIISLALVPWLVLRGYYVRSIRASIGHDEPLPPRFDGYRRLFADGLKSVAIATCYLLPGVAILAPLVYARDIGADIEGLVVASGVPASLAGGVLSGLGILAVFGLMYLIWAVYVIPAAVAVYAHAGRFLAAFDLRRVLSGAVTEDYVIAWLVSVLLQAVVLPVAYLLRVLLVGFFLHVVVKVGVHYCYGRGVGAGLGLDPVATRPGSGADGRPGRRGEPEPAVVPAEQGRLADHSTQSRTVRPTLAPAEDSPGGSDADARASSPEAGSTPRRSTADARNEPSGRPRASAPEEDDDPSAGTE
jgi:hypothetical protein